MRRIRAAVALFVRQTLHFLAGLPAETCPDALPDFPLRCQHCDNLIRLAAVHPSELIAAADDYRGPLFRDAGGHIACDRDHRILHKPMPSVLG